MEPRRRLLTGIDAARARAGRRPAGSGAAPVTDIGRSLRRDAPIVVLDAATGERRPYWAELDANATDGTRQALLVRRRPLPRTPRHDVLMHIAYGDHQVANVQADVQARTTGARLRVPALAPGRSPDVVPYWGDPARAWAAVRRDRDGRVTAGHRRRR